MTPIPAPPIAVGTLLPTLIVVGTALLVLVLDLLPPRGDKAHLGAVTLAGLVGTLLATLTAWGGRGRGFRDMVVLDNYALFFHVVIGYAAALVVLVSMDYLRRAGAESGEFYGLVLFATAGMMTLASANDLIVVFLGVELMSLSLYVLAGLFKRRRESSEASMKYFLLGVFASAFLLYGIALLYGATGSTNFDRIAAAGAAAPGDPLFVLGLGLLLVGFGFKIASVPFHMWAPDVYEGAPTSVTAFIATGSKAAVFAALIRLVIAGLRPPPPDATTVLWVLAAATMT
ncbi:MAG: NADH-quinone oxidoreductase subunit N, partial [Candidatus Rokuibacteriota bacterium]